MTSLSGFRSVVELPKTIHQEVEVLTEASGEIKSVRRRTGRLEEAEGLSADNLKHPYDDARTEVVGEDAAAATAGASDDVFIASGECGGGSVTMTDVRSARILTPPSPSTPPPPKTEET